MEVIFGLCFFLPHPYVDHVSDTKRTRFCSLLHVCAASTSSPPAPPSPSSSQLYGDPRWEFVSSDVSKHFRLADWH